MRLRWLFGNFADPQYKLSRKAEKEISWLAHHRHLRGWRFAAWSVLTIVLPIVLLMKFAIPSILQWLGYAGGSQAHTIAIALLALLAWPISAFAYGHLYVKPVRKAMRDSGFDICVTCGYLLNELPPGIAKCPECGGVRELLTTRDEADAADAADDAVTG